MPKYIGWHFTTRHGFKYNTMPTVRGSYYGGSSEPYERGEYGEILDCVYEMTDMIATSNGETVQKAMGQVLKDEGWRVLPSHQKMIAERLKDSP